MLLAPEAKGRGPDVRVDESAGPVRPVTDAGKARQVLVALLANAVRFTRAGEVRVEVGRAGDRAKIRVHHTGIGIAPEHLERICEPFWQVEQSSMRTVGGTGLGRPSRGGSPGFWGASWPSESRPGHGSTLHLRAPPAAAGR